jgi:hypothetical protein
MAATNLRLSVIQPRMLTEADAADYLSVPKTKLRIVCPVSPVEMPDGKRRYDVRDLDGWIDSLKDGGGSNDDILARLS